MGTLWTLLTIVGPIVLGAAVIYAIYRNRRETQPGDEARSDRAAKDLRDQLDKEEQQREHHS